MRPDASSLLSALTVLPKAIVSQTFDLGLLQLVLLDDLDDEVPLFTRAVPVTILGRLVLVVPVAAAVAAIAVATAPVAAVPATLTIVAVADVVAVAAIAVAVCWQVTGFLDAGIDAILEKFIQPGALGLNLRQVSDFGSEGDGELVGGIARQPELFAVVAFENYHVCPFVCCLFSLMCWW